MVTNIWKHKALDMFLLTESKKKKKGGKKIYKIKIYRGNKEHKST